MPTFLISSIFNVTSANWDANRRGKCFLFPPVCFLFFCSSLFTFGEDWVKILMMFDVCTNNYLQLVHFFFVETEIYLVKRIFVCFKNKRNEAVGNENFLAFFTSICETQSTDGSIYLMTANFQLFFSSQIKASRKNFFKKKKTQELTFSTNYPKASVFLEGDLRSKVWKLIELNLKKTETNFHHFLFLILSFNI